MLPLGSGCCSRSAATRAFQMEIGVLSEMDGGIIFENNVLVWGWDIISILVTCRQVDNLLKYNELFNDSNIQFFFEVEPYDITKLVRKNLINFR